MKLKKWTMTSLRTKMLVMFVLLTVIPLIFVGVVSYVKTYSIILEKSKSLAQLEVNQISSEIDEIFQDSIRFSELVKQDQAINGLTARWIDSSEDDQDLLNMFTLYRKSYPSRHILDISIISSTGKIINEQRGVYQLTSVPHQNPFLRHLFEQPTSTLIKHTIKNGFPVFLVTTKIEDELTNETIGVIEMILDAKVIMTILSTAKLGDSGTFHIVTEAGDALIYPAKNEELIATTNTGENKDDHEFPSPSNLTVSKTSELTGWKIIGQAPLNEVMHEAYQIRNLIFITVLCSIIFLVGLYFFISKKFIHPIRALKDKMFQASFGDLDVQISNYKEMDEISELNSSFNQMIKKIKSLHNKTIEKQKQLKAAEFRAMQAQVSPHFLYNTLDTIIWMAEAKNTGQVIEVTKALSQFFRISLSKGKDWITIEDELTHIRNYLIIQQIRYEDILEVTYHINEEILHYKILKLALQPLVENAIYHGIKNKRGKGFIRIKADFTSEGHILIEIIDNGIGINEERLNQVRTQLALGFPSNHGNGGFGMVNVQQRIRLFYGAPFGLSITSWYRSGTRVSLIIPAER
ncbi:sensor histidine kinase [Bacillus suaedae]|uniref:Sensor histidine kinase n=1 Tax=Halalkalibacter suaedae TaxID=2822140 RepID=A0A940WYK5_9BACI|nr:sensor histidine kinase [Bacillus suaedae]MBP3950871.1 sensor histidine kinase [Bacillus suaedae]